jgi:hypothetical protein
MTSNMQQMASQQTAKGWNLWLLGYSTAHINITMDNSTQCFRGRKKSSQAVAIVEVSLLSEKAAVQVTDNFRAMLGLPYEKK